MDMKVNSRIIDLLVDYVEDTYFLLPLLEILLCSCSYWLLLFFFFLTIYIIVVLLVHVCVVVAMISIFLFALCEKCFSHFQ